MLFKTFLGVELESIYHMIKCGVYIEAVDGTLYTSSTWTGNKTPNSVVIINDKIRLRLALTEPDKMPVGPQNSALNDYLPILSQDNAMIDYDGDYNTKKLIEFNQATGTNTTSYAAPYCKAFVFPNNVTTGHLLSAGEAVQINCYRDEVNSCLSACGGTPMSTDQVYHCSTRGTPVWASYVMFHWGWNYTYPYIGNDNGGMNQNYHVRAVAKY